MPEVPDSYVWETNEENLPEVALASMSSLNLLPQVVIEQVSLQSGDFQLPGGGTAPSGSGWSGAQEQALTGLKTVAVVYTNPSPHLAFFIEFSLVKGGDQQPVLPAFWSDNYVSLLPGETIALTVVYPQEALDGQTPEILVSGWNVSD